MYAYGKNVVKELINNNQKILNALVYEDFSDRDLILELKKRDISIKYLTKRELDNIEKENHQGIIVTIPEYNYISLEDLINSINGIPFLILLDHLEDPHNLGAIIRTCEAAGVDGIIIPKDRSVDVTPTVMKVSAGATNNMKICKVTNLNNTIKDLKKRGIWIIGTDMKNCIDYTAFDYNVPMALVIGNEGSGISRMVKENCDAIVKIPMTGKVNSLNASVGAGIMIYEVIRQRRK